MKTDYLPANSYSLSRNDYTPQQLELLDSVLTWANAPAKTIADICFTISGFAGTGKTTVARDIVRNLIGTVACTAPTHKAVRIASASIGVDGSTIQKLLGLRPDTDLENFDHNNPQFAAIGNVYIKNYKYILVDECSMINSGLLTILLNEAWEYGVKIIFIGDPYQIPPVKENYSKTFNVKHKYNLTQIVRQEENNPLIQLMTVARNSVRDKNDNIILAIDKQVNKYDTTEEHGYIITNGAHYGALLDDKFSSSEFESNIDYCRYLSFTNDAVLTLNRYVRTLLFGEVDGILIQDDLLTAYSTTMDEFNSPIILNSEDYIIYDIADYTNKYLINGYLVRLRSVNGGKITNRLFILDHTNQANLERYVSVFFKLLGVAKTAKSPMRKRDGWDKFWQYKHYNLLMTDVRTTNNDLVSRKNIDYGFGLTVHKSQGSTFDNVFIDARNIIYKKNGMPYYNKNLRNRLLYVALSRAKNTAFINY